MEGMPVGKKTWHGFKEYFAHAYRHYHIRKKVAAAAHGYGSAANHNQEIDTQIMVSDSLQALANVMM